MCCFFALNSRAKAHKKSTVLKPTQVNGYILPRRKDNHLEGTRQIDSVTLGKGGPCFYILEIRRHRIGGGDCLLKTQDSAKC